MIIVNHVGIEYYAIPPTGPRCPTWLVDYYCGVGDPILSKTRKSIIKKAKKQMATPTLNDLTYFFPINTLGSCTEVCIPPSCAPTPCIAECSDLKKKEHTMRYYDEHEDCYVETLPSKTDLAQTRSYLDNRLDEVRDNKYADLQTAFYLHADETPKTFKELMERIQAGKFIAPDEKVDAERAKFDWSSSPLKAVQWRDPAHPADEAGFETALKALDAAKTDACDIIKTSSEADGLAALKAFKSATFH